VVFIKKTVNKRRSSGKWSSGRSSRHQNRDRIGFFGPSGTFTEEAALRVWGKLISFDTIPEVFEAVYEGKVDMGVVPIENSIEGSVGITLDLLAHDYDLKIKKEIIVSISHNLLLNFNTDVEDVKIVYSHSQALSQCRNFIEGMGVVIHATPSTSAAAELITGKKEAAAIGTKRAAEIYGLKIAAQDIQDYKNNRTRFVVLNQEDHSLTGRDKTSLMFSLLEDKPGGLYQILEEFAVRNVNLTKIESRPSKNKLGSYIFFVDFEGHRDDPDIGNILNIIKSKVEYIKILGSYPKEGDD
jgi:prephenate dehydratase